MNVVLAIAVVIGLTGCMSVKQIPGPNGERLISATCNGTIRNWGDCLEAVAERCGPAGYLVVQRNGETFATSGSYIDANNGTGWSNSSTGVNRHMLAACKE